MKKALLFAHQWLGTALALLFLAWFASSLVLYFVPFTSLTPALAASLAGMPVLASGDACCLTACVVAWRVFVPQAPPPGITCDAARAPLDSGNTGFYDGETRFGHAARSAAWDNTCRDFLPVPKSRIAGGHANVVLRYL